MPFESIVHEKSTWCLLNPIPLLVKLHKLKNLSKENVQERVFRGKIMNKIQEDAVKNKTKENWQVVDVETEPQK